MTIRFQGTRAQLVGRLRAISAALAGTGPDPHHVVAPVLTAGAVALLSQIQTAFLVKARGGTGSDGIKWAPLKRATIAARRTSKAELKALGVGGTRTRGLLTPAEDKRWRQVYGQTLAQLNARGVAGASAIAAGRAWNVLKAEGAKTKLDVLGGRTVEILRDTNRLLSSLTPGYTGPDQILEAEPGRVTVGTSVEYAGAHHRGNPAKNLPARPLWSDDVPDAWMAAVNAAMLRGIVAAVTRVASGGG